MNKDKVIIEFIKHIEYNINKLNANTRNSIRNESIRVLKKITNNNLAIMLKRTHY